jgi:hypothetical protein
MTEITSVLANIIAGLSTEEKAAFADALAAAGGATQEQLSTGVGVTASKLDGEAAAQVGRLGWWARSYTGVKPIQVMATPPVVTLDNDTLSNLNGSNNAASLPATGLYPKLDVQGFSTKIDGTGNPNNNRLQAYGPADTNGNPLTANLTRVRFTLTHSAFEVVFAENPGSKINAIVDGELITAGAVGIIPNPLQSGGTRYMTFNFGADVVSYGMASGNIGAGGSTYAVGDTITMVGGTFTRPAIYRASIVNSGVVTGLVLQDPGDYTVLPTFPAATTTSGSGTGLTIADGFKFPRHTTLKARKVELLIEGAWLYGINFINTAGKLASGEAVITPYKFSPRIPRVYWLGDSQDAGTYSTWAGNQMGFLVGMRLGLAENLTIDARGGSGFGVAGAGNSAPFEHPNRVNAIIAAKPDVLIFPYSQNVSGMTQATSLAAANSFVAQIQAALPNCRLIMIGPAYGFQSWHLANMQAVLAAAAIPANIRMVDTISEGWASGGSAGFLTTDAVHWGQYGNLEWRSRALAERIADRLLDMEAPA